MTDHLDIVRYDDTETAEPTTPWQAIGWLLFTLLLICSPAIVWAVWSWAA